MYAFVIISMSAFISTCGSTDTSTYAYVCTYMRNLVGTDEALSRFYRVWYFHALRFGGLSLWFTGTQEKLEPPEVLASHSRREEICYERLSHRANAESQASVKHIHQAETMITASPKYGVNIIRREERNLLKHRHSHAGIASKQQ